MQQLNISIIIPAFKCAETIRYTLESLKIQTYKPFEIIIAYSNSPDKTIDILNEYAEILNLTIVRNTEKIMGPSEARNTAAAKAKGEILSFTDSDCILPQNWLETINDLFAARNISALSGPVNGALPSNIYEFYQSLFGLNIIQNDIIFSEFKIFESFGHTANFSVRADVFNSLNGFNEKLFYAEDHDFCARLLREGKNNLLFSNALAIKHVFRTDLKKFLRITYNYNKAHKWLLKNYHCFFEIRHKGKKIFMFKSPYAYIFEPFSFTKKISALILLSIFISPVILFALFIYLLKIKTRLSLKIAQSKIPEKIIIIKSESCEYKILFIYILESFVKEFSFFFNIVNQK